MELRDVMPTLLDLAGAPIPEHLDGKSMLHPIDREYLHGEHTFSFNHWSSQFIVTKTDKFVWLNERNEEQYFDLVHDPTRRTTPSTIRQAGADRVSAQSADPGASGFEEGYSDGTRLIPGRTPVNCLSNAALPNC